MATTGIAAGAVFVDVLPSFDGFGRALQNGIGDPARRAGEGAGGQAGDGMSEGLLGKIGKLAGPLAGVIAGFKLGEILVDSFGEALDRGAIEDKLSASLGLTEGQSAKAGAAAGNLYAGAYGENFEEVAEGLQGIIGSGLVDKNATQADLEAVGAQVFNLSAAFGEDTKTIADNAEQLLRNGLVGSAQEAFDVITVGFQSGANKAEDFLDTITEYSTIFRSLGIDAETATGLISQGLQAGARDGDTVADALKEFQIRATDGSKASAAGFEALGLSAADMTAQIAAGGKGASDGLGTVLDRLKAITDPVERNAAAVALFGTKAEDMGQALYALDPSTAVASLGEVAGAADKLGTTLNDNAATNIESFKRSLSTGLVTVIGGTVIPVLDRFASFVTGKVYPVLSQVGTVLGPIVTEVVGGVRAFAAAFSDGGDEITSSGFAGFLEGLGVWTRNVWDFVSTSAPLQALFAAVGAGAAAFGAIILAQKAWQALQFGAFLVQYALQVGIVSGVTRAWAVVQGVLNAVMALNPITLVVIAVAALAAGFYVLYQRSDSFRGLIQTVWSALKDGAAAVVSFFTDTVWPGIQAAFDGIGSAATWLWQNVIQPVWAGIAAAVDLYVGLVKAYITAWVDVILWVADKISWFYSNIVDPVFQLIGAAIAFAWNSVIQPVLQAIGEWLVGKLTSAFTTTRDAVLDVWAKIRDGISVVWSFIRDQILVPLGNYLLGPLVGFWTSAKDKIGDAFGLVKGKIQDVIAFLATYVWAPWATFLTVTIPGYFTSAKDAVGTKWDAVKGKISEVIDWVATYIWEPWRKVLTETIPGYFTSAVDAIGRAWDALKEAVKAPIRLVVGFVNEGLVDTFNGVASFFGTKALPKLALPDGFRDGGPIRGRGTGTSDEIPAMLSNGEHVLTAQDVRNMGGHGAILEARRQAAHFAKGGIVDAGKWFQSLGARVSEHPSFGGVSPVHKGRGHYEGRAIDVNRNGNNGSESDYEKAFFDKYAKPLRAAGWTVFWRDNDPKGHSNHLHLEAPTRGFLGDLVGGDGSGGSFLGGLFGGIGDLVSRFTSYVGSKFGAPEFLTGVGSAAGGAGRRLFSDVVDWVKNKADVLDLFSGGSSPVQEYDGAGGKLSPAQAKAAARTMIPKNWSFADLEALWTRESGWRWNADNPGSSAYGIPQALPGSKMRSAGSDWATNAVTQIRWGLDYIADRYGNSTKANAFQNSRNWYAQGGPVLYDQGGVLPPGLSSVLNASGKPEAIFTNAQAQALLERSGDERLLSVLENLVALVDDGNDLTTAGLASVVDAVAAQPRALRVMARQGAR